MGNAMKPASFCFPIWEAKISSLIPMVPTPSPEAWAQTGRLLQSVRLRWGQVSVVKVPLVILIVTGAKKHSRDP